MCVCEAQYSPKRPFATRQHVLRMLRMHSHCLLRLAQIEGAESAYLKVGATWALSISVPVVYEARHLFQDVFCAVWAHASAR